jgi:hypothetical protein
MHLPPDIAPLPSNNETCVNGSWTGRKHPADFFKKFSKHHNLLQKWSVLTGCLRIKESLFTFQHPGCYSPQPKRRCLSSSVTALSPSSGERRSEGHSINEKDFHGQLGRRAREKLADKVSYLITSWRGQSGTDRRCVFDRNSSSVFSVPPRLNARPNHISLASRPRNRTPRNTNSRK